MKLLFVSLFYLFKSVISGRDITKTMDNLKIREFGSALDHTVICKLYMGKVLIQRFMIPF